MWFTTGDDLMKIWWVLKEDTKASLQKSDYQVLDSNV